MNKPFKIAAIFLVILAVAMVVFYKAKERSGVTDTPLGDSSGSELKKDQSPLEGVYSSADGALEAGGKRLAFFQVVGREGGGFGGIARVEVVGANPGEGVTEVECQEVKLGESELFLRCSHSVEGSISFDGQVSRGEGGAVQVSGKLLWSKEGNPILDRTALKLSHSP